MHGGSKPVQEAHFSVPEKGCHRWYHESHHWCFVCVPMHLSECCLPDPGNSREWNSFRWYRLSFVDQRNHRNRSTLQYTLIGHQHCLYCCCGDQDRHLRLEDTRNIYRQGDLKLLHNSCMHPRWHCHSFSYPAGSHRCTTRTQRKLRARGLMILFSLWCCFRMKG